MVWSRRVEFALVSSRFRLLLRRYDDPGLPIIVTPFLEVGEEWRFVIVDGNVVAGADLYACDRAAIVRALARKF